MASSCLLVRVRLRLGMQPFAFFKPHHIFMDAKLSKIYYSPQGYWKGLAAVKKLAVAAKVAEEAAKKWLAKQALWQMYLVESLSKDLQTLAFKMPQLLQIDPGREFMGAVTKVMENNKTAIRRGRTEIHRDQAVVERFNRTLAERLFGHQYAVGMRLPSGKRSTEWVKRLPAVVFALNNEVTRLTGKKPTQAIKEKAVSSKPTACSRPVGVNEKKLPSRVNVRYLYQPGELEGGGRRATDPIWSLKVYNIERVVTKPDELVVYYLYDGPKRGFVREELMAVPPISL